MFAFCCGLRLKTEGQTQKSFVRTTILLLRQAYFCHVKHVFAVTKVFVATKILPVTARANERSWAAEKGARKERQAKQRADSPDNDQFSILDGLLGLRL